MRLIDADALKKDLTRFYDNEVTAKRLIDEQPTIEPQPQDIARDIATIIENEKDMRVILDHQWISVSEKLPKEDTEVIVSCTDDSGDSEFSYTTTGWHFKGVWVVGNERSYFVRAWMPLPEPYVERRQE